MSGENKSKNTVPVERKKGAAQARGQSRAVSADNRDGKNNKDKNSKSARSVSEQRSGRGAAEQMKIDPVPKSSLFKNQLLPFVFFVVAILFAAFFLLSSIDGAVGSVGVFIRNFFCGLLGWPAFLMPLILINLAIFWRKYVDLDIVGSKIVMSVGCVLTVSGLVHVFSIPTMNPTHYNWADFGASIFGHGEVVSNWTYGVRLTGGGFLGGLLGGLVRSACGYVGAVIILLAMLAIMGLFLFGISPAHFVDTIRYKISKKREAEADVREERREERRIERAERRETDRAIKADRRRAAAIEAQLLREDREAELAARRAERAKAAAEVKRHRVPDFDELLPGGADLPPKGDDSDAGDAPVLVTPMPDDPAPLSRAESVRVAADVQNIELTPAVPEPSVAAQMSATVETSAVPAVPAAPTPAYTEAEVRRVSPVRECRRASDPYGVAEIFREAAEATAADNAKRAADAAAATPAATASASAVVPDIAPAAESESARDDSAGELEIKLTPITDTEQSDADITAAGTAAAGRVQERQSSDYTFPPVELLHPNSEPSAEDVELELRTNAQKLMETLSSFNVKIKKIEYSRGPTITRYELYPEAGTRIRTISNLVDDIALSLATTGVRIEAPIPNKSAVGVEVPNRTRATVFIRELIESETFRNSKSKLTACLGKDVAGNMIIFDIAKMPHLLIAGTTGSGKSVCINSIIISLLYKARPDEVKLIMIDPKKIEMSMYSDLPHLKVPVVTDTKRATGTLNAAVNEMEHRFELFEDVGVRDIDGYNKITAGDPEHPKLPKIVIIIDELADLMMTAPDQIETSICRLAQKARAAGIHLIIGTQRPSVDVITGLIKANVPSRIAFTVASQVDSRTIIDIAGAEKLIGKGDMLYAPIGSLKPRRAQGTLVVDDEVEAVNSFIKDNYGCADYDGDFISDIDREAERVAAGKKGAASMGGGADSSGGGAAGGDPQFRQALKIAVDNGTIATSYLQRTLSIGYGRAARLIDQMAKLGFVSGMNGTKPRTVLLTLSQYMELESRGDSRLDGIIPSEEEG